MVFSLLKSEKMSSKSCQYVEPHKCVNTSKRGQAIKDKSSDWKLRVAETCAEAVSRWIHFIYHRNHP